MESNGWVENRKGGKDWWTLFQMVPYGNWVYWGLQLLHFRLIATIPLGANSCNHVKKSNFDLRCV